MSTRFSRIVLALVVVYAVVRLVDPLARWASLYLKVDKIEHAAVAYLVVTFTLASFPRLGLWTPALALSAFGAAVELLQAHPQITGAAQPGDVIANAAGCLIATFPVWLARARGRLNPPGAA